MAAGPDGGVLETHSKNSQTEKVFYDRLDWQAIEHDFRKDIPGKSLKQCRQRYYKIREKVEARMLNHCEDLAVNDSRLV